MARATTTIGIDLSAQPKATAACVLEWRTPQARVVHLEAGASDGDLLELVADYAPQKVAIDAPFGWPAPFIKAIGAFSESGSWPPGSDHRALLLRTTDLAAGELTGTYPLSVSSDKLAVCAMRCASLVVQLMGSLDRTGAGLVAEVYPAAALRQWGLDPRGYKGAKPEKVEKRARLLTAVADATSQWLELGTSERALLNASDHHLDALLSAIIGRAVALGLTLPIPDEHREIAATEGWIHLPQPRSLAELNPFRG